MFKKISVAVISIHALLLIILTIHHFFSFKTIPKKMVVSTISLSKTTPIIPSKSSITPTPTPKSEDLKKNTASKTISKTNQIKVSPPPKKAEIEKKQAAKTLDEKKTLLSKQTTQKQVLSVPSKIQSLPEHVEEQTRPQYSQYLASYLQQELDLPELGEVKVFLEIDKHGHLQHLKILETQSQINSDYLLEKLPLLTFPSPIDFGSFENNFTITFKNKDNNYIYK
jgi:hypothetical protein